MKFYCFELNQVGCQYCWVVMVVDMVIVDLVVLEVNIKEAADMEEAVDMEEVVVD